EPMMNLRDSLSKKLTVMNMMVSGVALLLASASFFAYDLITFRDNLIAGVSVQAQIIGSNAISPLIFNDPRSAESTLSALHASPHIVYAAIYAPTRSFFAGYPSAQAPAAFPLADFAFDHGERYWFG